MFNKMRSITILLVLQFLTLQINLSYSQERELCENYSPEWISLGISDVPSSQQVVTWRSPKNSGDGIAQIIRAKSDINRKNIRNAQTITAISQIYNDYGIEKKYHKVVFSDLSPSENYLYRVGNDECWSEWFQFRTAGIESDTSFSFLYLGDVQYEFTTLYPRVIRQAIMKASDASFIIFAGDLTGKATEEQFNDFFSAGNWILASKPVVPIPDAHEYRENALGERRAELTTLWSHMFYYPRSAPDELYESGSYYFDYQNARFIMINSYDLLRGNSEKKNIYMNWLESLFKNNSQSWTVVVHHIPLYPITKRREKSESWYNLLKPLYDKYGVDLVLSGHDHGYARGGIELEGKEQKIIKGPVYVISVAGPHMYEVANRTWYDRIISNTQLFQHIQILGNQLQFNTFDATGNLLDDFIINKSVQGKLFIDKTLKKAEY